MTYVVFQYIVLKFTGLLENVILINQSIVMKACNAQLFVQVRVTSISSGPGESSRSSSNQATKCFKHLNQAAMISFANHAMKCL